mgnify:CR=1 FL=1
MPRALKIIDDIEGPQSISHGRMDAMEEIVVSHMNEYFHNMDLSRLSPSPSGEILDLFKKALIVNFEYYRRDDNIQRARLYAYISNLYAINNAINNEVIWALNAFKESANILRRLDLMRNRFVRPIHVDLFGFLCILLLLVFIGNSMNGPWFGFVSRFKFKW